MISESSRCTSDTLSGLSDLEKRFKQRFFDRENGMESKLAQMAEAIDAIQAKVEAEASVQSEKIDKSTAEVRTRRAACVCVLLACACA